MKKSTTRLLMEAREKIKDPQNWVRGDWHVRHMHCSLGAVEQVLLESGAVGALTHGRRTPEMHNAAAYLARQVRIRGHNPLDTVMNFNDTYGRTHGEVMTMFCSAIRAAAKDEGIEVQDDDLSTN